MDDVLFLGIDIGSVSVKTALVLPDGALAAETYSRIKGDPLSTLLADLSAHFRSVPESRVRSAGITGSGGKLVADALGAVFVNEILAQATFVGRFHPGARTVVELGGEDAKLISLGAADTGGAKIEDFAMNTACAAGTGSFLDQQATRLALTIEEFGALSLRSANPPAVAGRCSVFAKSDMIHLQQIATPDHDIVAGLCFAMARNFKATVGKGRTFHPPVLFLGGVAANPGMRRAFREVLGLGESEFFAPEHFSTAGAIGAALVAREGRSTAAFRGLDGLRECMARQAASGDGMTRLFAPRHIMPNPSSDAAPGTDGLIEAYLGVDVGSVSTNVVVIDREMRVLSKRYLPTAGRPIEAVKQGLAEVGGEIGGRVKVLAAGTTGSGRYLTGDMIGADVVRNEITAQATAAAAIDPSVDTIFEIGGQDSKFISLQQGAVVDFEMNKACAAGTGSFLEEQAERLGISIREEFARRALRSPSPCGLGERCTVFMESDLVHYLNRGAGVDDLTAGLAYSIVQNYLNKVVAGKKVGERIFFQGGVAANAAVVAAFEKVTGKRITVPPHHEVTGAIGAAILAMRARPRGPSAFKGFDLARRRYTISTFECHECSNRCDIRKVSFDGEAPLFYGSRCEKYDVKKKAGGGRRLPDLFAEREHMLTAHGQDTGGVDGRPVIGIPRMLFLNDFLPFWRTFFGSLGFRVAVSERTNRTIIAKGLEAAAAESCFPSRAALGHIKELLEKGVDYLFLPSYIRFPSSVDESGAQACPYVQAMPYLAHASLNTGAVKVLEPRLFLQDERHARRSIAALGAALGKSRTGVERARKAAEKAQAEFDRCLAERGREALAGLGRGEKALVLIGRSYNTTDTGMNMNLPAKIRDLGVQAVPMDLLPLHEADLSGWDQMYWRSGQRLLAAARYLKERPGLYPVYITNFGCGPDSFISHFFREEMGGKPFLQLEIDEHSADAGAVTRIEAFLDSIANARSTDSRAFSIARHTSVAKRKVFLPPMADHAHALAAAFRACGVDTEVLPESDDETMRIGKVHSSGRECFPLALTVGDMIKATRRPGFDPDRSAFFMPAGRGPCRFGQYHLYHRHVLDRIGLPHVPVYSPMQDETMHRDTGVVGKDLVRLTWRGALAVDMFQKALFEHRPYEKNKGESDRVYQESLNRLVSAIEQKKDLRPVLRKSYGDFRDVEIAERDKPVIGIVGEIYVRSNRFSNEDVIRQVEMLGGEAWLAPVSEWLLYVTETSKTSARMRRAWKDLIKAHLTDWFQRSDERAFLSTFNGTLRSLHEPAIKRTLRTARPYIHHSFEGEAVLSVGKAIDYVRRGVSGIVNVMPFTCMPGTIAGAVLKRVREEHGNIPLLNIAYEGQKDSQTLTRLEAFIHQARGYREAKEKKKS